MPDFIGQSFGRYHILEQLGEGGMATVFKAYDTRLERDAAVKIIRRDVFPPNQLENILKRFEREAKALARLIHPNIVSVIDYGEQDGTPYLVMAYLPGGTLKQRLGKPVAWQEAFRLLIPVARALQFAHSQNIVHRDVKPSNILITLSGEPMLTDFGIAKILDVGEGQTLTGTGVGVGTPEYMAPEQWTGHAGPLSDIYSLGVVLYELLTGHKPYVADTPAAVLLKQNNDPLPRPSQFVPDLPETVEKLLFKALAKKPEDRFPDMGAMVAALESVLANSRSDTQPRSVEKTISAPAPLSEKDSPTAIAQEAASRVGQDIISSSLPSRRTKLLPFGIGVLALLVIAGGILGINYLTKNMPVFSTLLGATTPAQTSTSMLKAGDTWSRPADGMLMVYVPEGRFIQGSKNGNNDEKPVHTVYLDAFWIDQTEVTNKMYALCVAAGKCPPPEWNVSYLHSKYFGNPEYDNFPVIFVSWNDAFSYCAWAGGAEYNVSLPTEAEWEKAARGTDKRTYPWGEGIDCQKANYHMGSNFCKADTARVGSYESGKSPYGAYDMAGNVWEWVADWYSDSYYESLHYSARNPIGPASGVYRVLRGGAWNLSDTSQRSANRTYVAPTAYNDDIGFRCARTP